MENLQKAKWLTKNQRADFPHRVVIWMKLTLKMLMTMMSPWTNLMTAGVVPLSLGYDAQGAIYASALSASQEA